MNNINQLMNFLSTIKDPMGQLNKMANSNPTIASMLSGGNYEQVARNLCKERGIDVDQLYNTISKLRH